MKKNAIVWGTTLSPNLLLLSGSRAAGNLVENAKPGYLDFAEPWIKKLFENAISNATPVLFVPYARPSGWTEQKYYEYTKDRTEKMGITLICAPESGVTHEILKNVGGIFIGGGNTYQLTSKLHSTGSLEIIHTAVLAGLPYLGSSAGTVITGPTMRTTNDMFSANSETMDSRSFGFLNTHINVHYLNNQMHLDSKHQGETRDTRLNEFCTFNQNDKVLGLYEGQAIRVNGENAWILTSSQARETNSPIFGWNETTVERVEVECKIGIPQEVSQIC